MNDNLPHPGQRFTASWLRIQTRKISQTFAIATPETQPKYPHTILAIISAVIKKYFFNKSRI